MVKLNRKYMKYLFGVNTKFVLGLPRAKQVGLEHAKKKTKEV